MFIKTTFNVPMTDKVGGFPPTITPIDTGTNRQFIEVFHDDEWTEPAKGIVLFLRGGAGIGSDAIDNLRVQYCLPRGYVYINHSAYPQHPWYVRVNSSVLHDQFAGAYELQSVLEFIKDELLVNPDYEGILSENTKVVPAGQSRGAGVVCGWATQAQEEFTANVRDMVPACFANSPAGSRASNLKWVGAYVAARQVLEAYARVAMPLVGTWGAGDVTHTSRPLFIRVMSVLNNPNVKTFVVGDDTYGHGWPYNESEEFMEAVIRCFDFDNFTWPS